MGEYRDFLSFILTPLWPDQKKLGGSVELGEQLFLP